MRPCDPSSSATQHTLTAAISCFNSMYFAPRPCARCPPREHQFIARLFRMPRPCSFLHLGMLTDTVRARPASKRRIYRPCARPVRVSRSRSLARLLRTEPTARFGSMALTQVGFSLQTACPRHRGTRADSLEFLRALGARPESARSEYGPKSSHPDPYCCLLYTSPSPRD